MSPEDAPYSLSDKDERQRRLSLLTEPHMKPLADFVQAIPTEGRSPFPVPNFDPCDGGIGAKALFLLEAPGPQAAKTTGFVSRNNPDQTAKNLCLLMQEAGISRRDTLIWNIVPWYVGTGTHIKPVTNSDLAEAQPCLKDLLTLLPHLKVIVLVGLKAQKATKHLRTLTHVPLVPTYHTSPLVFNISQARKQQTQEKFRDIAARLQAAG